jgi:hypothetical protein
MQERPNRWEDLPHDIVDILISYLSAQDAFAGLGLVNQYYHHLLHPHEGGVKLGLLIVDGRKTVEQLRKMMQRVRRTIAIEYRRDHISFHRTQRLTYDDVYRKIKKKYASSVVSVTFTGFPECNEVPIEFINAAVQAREININMVGDNEFWNWPLLTVNPNVVSVAFLDPTMRNRDEALVKFPNANAIRHWTTRSGTDDIRSLDITWEQVNGEFRPVKVLMTGLRTFPNILRRNLETIRNVAIRVCSYDLLEAFLFRARHRSNEMPHLTDLEIQIRGDEVYPHTPETQLWYLDSHPVTGRIGIRRQISIIRQPDIALIDTRFERLPNY